MEKYEYHATEEEGSSGEPLESSSAEKPQEPSLAGEWESGTAAQDFPVVGIGASAGGLEALKSFFASVPASSGFAYIVVMHLSPDQPSVMDELLQRECELPVSTAVDGQEVAPGNVYIAPAHTVVHLYRGVLQLVEPLTREKHKPIDLFLRSLAQDQGKDAAAVILSGTGSDGSVGARYVKEYEGTVLAQSQETAQYNGMPNNVVEAGVVDLVLAPTEMPHQLERYFAHRSAFGERREELQSGEREKWLNKILSVLRTQVGHDFYAYKKRTLIRRINRRMSLQQIQEYDRYFRFLRNNTEEVEALFRELLIGVTHFFRDPASYEMLKKNILPDLIAKMNDDEYLRVWVPGCSSGEEAYSLAMVLKETIEAQGRRIHPQIFGTDIDSKAIEKARDGVYAASIAEDVGEERLRRFFTQEGEHYRIRKEIRDSVVFSVQDILKDPPFSRLHLLCCRNLMIYLEASRQKKLIPLFHYTLLPRGILMLGSSETIGGFTNLFEQMDKKWKIYKKREVHASARGEVEFPTGPSTEQPMQRSRKRVDSRTESDYGGEVRKLLLDYFAPTAVLVDSNGTILYIQGRTGKYLEAGTGLPTQDIIDMAREGLRLELSSTIRRAHSSGKKVRRSGIKIQGNDELTNKAVDLHVYPLDKPEHLAGKLLVVFQDRRMPESDEQGITSDEEGITAEAGSSKEAIEHLEPENRIAELERELQNTRESHQTTTEQLESANEELKSTNEELQSSNEELQSTNEELESSKEELQSLNEELQTVNAELQSKVDELSLAQDDLRNLLNSTNIATIFVDNELHLKRFTQEATSLFNVIQGDIGRPFEHVTTQLNYGGIGQDVRHVLNRLEKLEKEVQTEEGHWYDMSILPYRTTDNRIDGAVLVFQDINEQKQQQERLAELSASNEEAWELLRSVFDMNTEPLVVTDIEGGIVIANTAFCHVTGLPQGELFGRSFFTVKGIAEDDKELRKLFQDAQENTGPEPRSITASVTISPQQTEDKEQYTVSGRTIFRREDLPLRILLRFQREAAENG